MRAPASHKICHISSYFYGKPESQCLFLPRTSTLILLNFVFSFKILPVHLYLQETSQYSGVIPMQLPSSVCIPILLYISFLQFLFY